MSSFDTADQQVIESYRPTGRIYLYVCGGPGGKHPFTQGTHQDLHAEKIVAVPGMRLDFYCDDGNEKGERDYLLFSGVIDQFPTGDWYAVVDGDRFWHESEVGPC
jgi:hypothetical protein